jgi:heat shock protein HslJ
LPECILDGHLPQQFSVRGNEPSWQLSSDQLTLQQTRESNPRQWLLHDQQGQALELTASLCQDSMSGRYYPYQARYSNGDTVLSGCGGDSQRLLAGSSWQLVGNFADSVRPQLQFGTDASVSGYTGCNNFRGSYELNPETFAFKPLAVTRKACETEIMALEHDFLRQLLEVEQFSFAADGQLQLHPRGGDLLVWEKTSTPQT